MTILTQAITSTQSVSNAEFLNQTQMASLGSMTNVTASTEALKLDGLGFGDVMADMAQSTVNKLQEAERVSLDAVQGKANTREVVDALMTAEQSLQTAIAIRDKIVTAYLDVTRMQI